MNVTILVKSFMRPETTLECVESIRQYYDHPILVADDSYGLSQSHFSKYKNTTFYQLEYDVGLGAGRNFLVDKVDTPYFILLDNDFLFDQPNKIENLYAILKENDATISAGALWDIGKASIRRFCGFFSHEEHVMMNFYDLNKIHYEFCGGIPFCGCQFTENFFLGKTEDFDKWNIQWCDAIQSQEHEDFYIRFPKSLRITFSPGIWVRHNPGQDAREPRYCDHRFGEKMAQCRSFILKRYGLTYDGKNPRGYFFPYTLNNVYDWTTWQFPRFLAPCKLL
jgi:glycosyltransferase involved in cell wall biosynthesis